MFRVEGEICEKNLTRGIFEGSAVTELRFFFPRRTFFSRYFLSKPSCDAKGFFCYPLQSICATHFTLILPSSFPDVWYNGYVPPLLLFPPISALDLVNKLARSVCYSHKTHIRLLRSSFAEGPPSGTSQVRPHGRFQFSYP